MTGRTTYTRGEIDRARLLLSSQLAAYHELERAVRSPAAPDAGDALAEFSSLFFNTLALALDRPFADRVRPVPGDGGALDELALVVDALTRHDGVFEPREGLPYAAGISVLGLVPGRRVRLSAHQFERLADAVFAELEARLAADQSGDMP